MKIAEVNQSMLVYRLQLFREATQPVDNID